MDSGFLVCCRKHDRLLAFDTWVDELILNVKEIDTLVDCQQHVEGAGDLQPEQQQELEQEQVQEHEQEHEQAHEPGQVHEQALFCNQQTQAECVEYEVSFTTFFAF